jgi:hypothetical protein
MARQSQKKHRKVLEKDSELEELLRAAFRTLNAQKRSVAKQDSVNTNETKVQ